MDEEQRANKPHMPAHKAKTGVDIHNIKANGYSNGFRARQAISHQLNIEQLRLDQQETHMYNYEDPPLLVAVQGPPQCGKSLLIKGLVKYYSTDLKLIDIRGPITVVANRSQRITFIEVPNDINAMCDVAKIADLVLLMVNAERNFEMETFEFLNLLMSHGTPKIIGVISHLDICDRSVGNQLKARFHKEVGTTAKVYKLEKMIHGQYEKKAIMNLSRRLNIRKVRVINFRKDRGYLLVDRAEPGTSSQNPDQKTTLLFGYCRGDGLSNGQRVHIPGAGDFTINSITELDDPCPLTDPKTTSQRTLKQQTNRIYAPMSETGGTKIDENAIYTDIPRHWVNFTDPKQLQIPEEEAAKLAQEIKETEGVKIIKELHQSKEEEPEDEMIQLFPGLFVPLNQRDQSPEQNEQDEQEQNEQNKQNVNKQISEYEYEEEEEEEEMHESQLPPELQPKNEDSDVDNVTNMDDFIADSDNDDIGEQIIPKGEIKPGKYVRVEFTDIPPELLSEFDPRMPVIIGSLLQDEQQPEACQQWLKIRRHRFYDRIPKSSDPMIITVGWRRFQTVPIFFNEERDGKLRFLKYMPDLLTCYASYYGPPSAINIGVTAFQHIKENLRAFRITATGVTIKKMGDGRIVKKLRINGHPKEIFKKTAKISDMFTSELEAKQFENAIIRTVSGIRGRIKHVEKDGVVRCTFEDTIKQSDIVFLNGWVNVPVEEFYTPIDSLLSKEWRLIKTTAELRSDLNLRPQYDPDSVYRNEERPELPEFKLTAPKSLIKQLPYTERKKLQQKPVKKAVIANEAESEIFSMIQKTKQVFEAKKKEKEKEKKALEERARKQAEKEQREQQHKRTLNKKEFFRKHPKKSH